MNKSRYIRQTRLPQFGKERQEKLSKARVLVIGAGGLGIPVLQYLNAMGLGTLGIVENDKIELTNLQRQVIYSEKDHGKSKLEVIVSKLKAQNSETKIIPFDTFFSTENAEEIAAGFDIIIDCSDNFATRYLVNDVCVIQEKPLVYGALHGFEGQVSVFNYNDGPTYRCLFPKMPQPHELPDCNTNGVLGVLPGIIGTFQALETVKLITGIGEVLSGKLLIYDGLSQNIRHIKFKKDTKNSAISELQATYEQFCDTASINASEFEKIRASENIQIIDVRSPQEYSEFSLDNSVNIPLDKLERNIASVDKLKDIYLICQSGVRSGKAVEILKKHQFTKLKNVEGGINSIKKYGIVLK
ncbi:HesA/MoeB/ThiF family protein [Gramella jeungdoensis]|uniref:HesA/MoeB/ThiF family protein n=1 Tax=Gramella jeungdoensis TaxID=708091 RepID=A0ABT0Z1J4_9FLAO|nr:HesA/MoeB/ThiF family protein [Gramella jeungdoensis]MCM8569260.1 HesA/MoeB/ThiF family protein [Gramella jeungdoensis]